MMLNNTLFWRQIILFSCLYFGYTIYIFCRKSFSYSAAAISGQEKLGKSDLGLIVSSQALAYTIGKFSSGLLVDRLSPKWMFSFGLFFTGISTIAFTYASSLWVFSALWFINGLAGGPGWPSIAKFLKTWFPADQLGTLWSGMSTSRNVAGSLGPLLAATLAGQIGWRMAMCLPGVVAVFFTVISLVSISDKPSDVGLPDFIPQDKTKKTDEETTEQNEVTLRDVLNPFFFKLSICFMVTMCIRTACSDWGQLYLIQDLGHSHLVGSGFTSSQEVGGIVGSIIAGYISDKLVTQSSKGSGSSRMLVVLVNSTVTSLALLALVTIVTSTVSQVWISIIGFCLGFSLYGSIALDGVMAVEAAPVHLSGTAHSIVALSANVGVVLAGLPLSWIASIYQWTGAFYITFLISWVPVILSLSIVVLKSNHTESTKKSQ